MTSSSWSGGAALVHRQNTAGQSGQAMVEGIAILGVLMLVCLAIAWLGRFQDMALSAQHASRHAAFQHARTGEAMTSGSLNEHYFSGTAHQWTDRRGQSLLGAGLKEVSLVTRKHALNFDAQPGGPGAYAGALRSDWGIQGSGVVQVEVSLAGASSSPDDGMPKKRWLRFDIGAPTLRRHTAILIGAGHGSGDTQVQQSLALSGLAWGNSAGSSINAGTKVAAVMNQVDSAWNRAVPDFDWLGPWAGRIPEHHLTVAGWRPND